MGKRYNSNQSGPDDQNLGPCRASQITLTQALPLATFVGWFVQTSLPQTTVLVGVNEILEMVFDRPGVSRKSDGDEGEADESEEINNN